MDEAFENRVRIATGMSLEDCCALAEEQEALLDERIRAQGYCCQAGFVGFPASCPWHDASATPENASLRAALHPAPSEAP